MKFNQYITENEETDLDRILSGFDGVVSLLTTESQNIGMLQYEEPPKDTALLFIFEEAGKWQITTEGMKWPIDILFFDENKNLIHTEENCGPGYLIIPGRDCKYVVETAHKMEMRSEQNNRKY